ncbi:MAG: C4-dicarboxylate TRAP transporter substrate-binding protein, partial [Rhodobacterales bacterium]
MKRFLLSATASVLIAMTGAAQAQSLFVGEAGPNRGARAESLQWFADTATELSGGTLDLNIQWGGALFKANAAVNGISDGVA